LFDTAQALNKILNRPNFAYNTSFTSFGIGSYQFSTKNRRGHSPLGVSMGNITKVFNIPIGIDLWVNRKALAHHWVG
jgi:hypothetical protein